MQQVLATVAIVAPQKTTVLISGETGTGKELVARALHFQSPRRSKPFVAINCAALAETLLEDALFGHERGAFTDAHDRRIGCFEAAHRGTLFLDEVGELSHISQAKLLRVLEEKTLTRVGGTEPLPVDVRVVAATNHNLAQVVREGSFRADLYYRLNVIAIALPPLRERREDILPLLSHFLCVIGQETGRGIKRFTLEALAVLLDYSWPGNVRELANVVEHCVLLAPGLAIGPEDLPIALRTNQDLRAAQELSLREKTLPEAVAGMERNLILAALTRAGANQSQAAQLLGISRRMLGYKMVKLGISSHVT